jgi:peptidoglycan/LPS O-acetylase OafA/YrhL
MVARRDNNFGLLRLIFASMVIVSHSPLLLDGDRSREFLTRIFGTLTGGDVAVDGFFLISGYLIVKSFIDTPSLGLYMKKRVARIVPGYAVAFLISALCIGPFVGGAAVLSVSGIGHLLTQMATLLPPKVIGVFPGLHYPSLNSSLWTIRFEFECYLAVAALGALGLLRPQFWRAGVAVAAALVVLNVAGALEGGHQVHEPLLPSLAKDTRFFMIFAVGAVFYLFRDRIKLCHAGAAAAAVLLIGSMFSWRLAEAGFTLFGGYLIFWFAFAVRPLHLGRLTRTEDISYGVYLYGWPAQTLIVWNFRTIDPWLLSALALSIAAVLGYASWMLVEKPSLRLARGRG